MMMLIVGTAARAAAGTLSSTILFVIVALGGGMFGKSVGGGIGTVIMAISCALISKRALSGAKGFEGLRRIAFAITSTFGTSFRNAKLFKANFAGSKIRNSDFSDADISSVNWGDAKKMNCIIKENRTENG
jgi:Pentapeptide repeats (8 copies)